MERNDIRLKHLYMGRVDANNELSGSSDEEIERFFNSFLMPANIDIEDYLTKKNCFVLGLKGTGKTALLRYMALIASRERKAATTFMLFKRDVSEEDRLNFGQSKGDVLVEGNIPRGYMQDYELVWSLFLYRLLIKTIEEQNISIFRKDSDWSRFVSLIKSPDQDKKSNSIMRLFPKLKKGTLSLGADFVAKGELGLEFEWENAQKKTIRIEKFVERAHELFKALRPGSGNLYIFIDELELTLSHQEKYDRDAILIRDLVLISERFNANCRALHFGVKIISGVRSEVLTAVQAYGKEINKPISDFGSSLTWHLPGKNIYTHPLLTILIQRLITSEMFNGVEADCEPSAIWGRYFPERVSGQPIEHYLLHNSWYRPRDLVRITNVVQDSFKDETMFTEEAFKKTRKEYAKASWIEIAEELRLKYRPKEISAIQTLLTGSRAYFYLNEVEGAAIAKSRLYKTVAELMSNHQLGDILSDLYRVGAIGNGIKGNIRFAFRGDEELILESAVMVHPALRARFSIVED